MQVATGHMEKTGWHVADVSAGKVGWDLTCTRGSLALGHGVQRSAARRTGVNVTAPRRISTARRYTSARIEPTAAGVVE